MLSDRQSEKATILRPSQTITRPDLPVHPYQEIAFGSGLIAAATQLIKPPASIQPGHYEHQQTQTGLLVATTPHHLKKADRPLEIPTTNSEWENTDFPKKYSDSRHRLWQAFGNNPQAVALTMHTIDIPSMYHRLASALSLSPHDAIAFNLALKHPLDLTADNAEALATAPDGQLSPLEKIAHILDPEFWDLAPHQSSQLQNQLELFQGLTNLTRAIQTTNSTTNSYLSTLAERYQENPTFSALRAPAAFLYGLTVNPQYLPRLPLHALPPEAHIALATRPELYEDDVVTLTLVEKLASHHLYNTLWYQLALHLSQASLSPEQQTRLNRLQEQVADERHELTGQLQHLLTGETNPQKFGVLLQKLKHSPPPLVVTGVHPYQIGTEVELSLAATPNFDPAADRKDFSPSPAPINRRLHNFNNLNDTDYLLGTDFENHELRSGQKGLVFNTEYLAHLTQVLRSLSLHTQHISSLHVTVDDPHKTLLKAHLRHNFSNDVKGYIEFHNPDDKHASRCLEIRYLFAPLADGNHFNMVDLGRTLHWLYQTQNALESHLPAPDEATISTLLSSLNPQEYSYTQVRALSHILHLSSTANAALDGLALALSNPLVLSNIDTGYFEDHYPELIPQLYSVFLDRLPTIQPTPETFINLNAFINYYAKQDNHQPIERLIAFTRSYPDSPYSSTIITRLLNSPYYFISSESFLDLARTNLQLRHLLLTEYLPQMCFATRPAHLDQLFSLIDLEPLESQLDCKNNLFNYLQDNHIPIDNYTDQLEIYYRQIIDNHQEERLINLINQIPNPVEWIKSHTDTLFPIFDQPQAYNILIGILPRLEVEPELLDKVTQRLYQNFLIDPESSYASRQVTTLCSSYDTRAMFQLFSWAIDHPDASETGHILTYAGLYSQFQDRTIQWAISHSQLPEVDQIYDQLISVLPPSSPTIDTIARSFPEKS